MNKTKLLKDEDIKNIFAQIETPEYNPADDVIKKIKQSDNVKPKRKIKRIYVTAIVLSAALILMSAGVAISNIMKVTVYDMFGNATESEMLIRSGSYIRSEMEAFAKDYGEEGEHAIFYRIRENAEGDYEAETYPKPKIIKDYDELKEYLNKIDDEIYKLPEYIPNGYEFLNAEIYLQVCGDINFDELEPVYYEQKSDGIYEKYILPETKRSISSVYVTYQKGEECIRYSISFDSFDLKNTTLIVTDPSVTVETEMLDIPKFDVTAIASALSGNYQVYSIRAVNHIEPFNILEILAINKTWREFQFSKRNEVWSWEYGSVVYNVGSPHISRDEIIKIAESIK